MNTYKKENIDISDYKSVVDYIYSILETLNIDYYIRNIETIELNVDIQDYKKDNVIVIWLKPNNIITNSNLPQIHIYVSNTEFENKDIIAKKIIKAFEVTKIDTENLIKQLKDRLQYL